MPFELPDDSTPTARRSPGCWALAGDGNGDYPTIDPFKFRQELIFQQDGRPFFHYLGRAENIDEAGKRSVTPPWRPGSSGARRRAPSSSCSPTTPASSSRGAAPRRPASRAVHRAVVRTESAKEYTGGKRLYGLVEGDLLYAYDMAAMGQPLQPHTWAVGHEERLAGSGERVHTRLHWVGGLPRAHGGPVQGGVDPATARLPPHPSAELVLRRCERLGHATPTRCSPPSVQESQAVNIGRSTARWSCWRSSGWCGTPTSATRRRPTTPLWRRSTSISSAGRARQVAEADPDVIEAFTDSLAHRYGFTTDVGHLTIFGTCRDCGGH